MTEGGVAQHGRTISEPHYSPGPLETRWQDIWRETRSFEAPGPEDSRQPAYVLAGCPIVPTDTPIAQLRTFTIADTCARFLRMRGRAVLFSLGIDTFGQEAETEVRRVGVSPHEWARRRGERMRHQLETLGCSFDWARTFTISDAHVYRWTQWLFLALLERDLIYRQDEGWSMRMRQYVDESEGGLDAPADWDTAAIDSQRTILGRIDGVEVRASLFGGVNGLTVFTPYADAIAKATFVAVSPAHPDVRGWASDPELARQLAVMNEMVSRPEAAESGPPMVVTGALATVPGAAGLLPVVISPLVDVRFGATAVLGIPELDYTDRAIGERLPKPAGPAWKTSSSGSPVRPAVRYRVEDLSVSCSREWGVPIPVVHCPACGATPVPREDLPVRLPDDLLFTAAGEAPLADGADFHDCPCPRCGGAARRETDTIDPRLNRMWMWMSICVPAERRSSAMMNDPEYARWLPAAQLVARADMAACVFEQRVFARILQDLGELAPLSDREPFSRALLHGGLCLQDATTGECSSGVFDPDELIARVGGDTIRLTLLYAAAPVRSFTWSEGPLHRCRRFLEDLYGYAEPRLREWADTHERNPARIDASEKLRRRLAYWCTTACEKITQQLERLELQRAAHNAMLLLTRIQDFESRAAERRGELEALDCEAIVAALLELTRLLAPLTPHIAEELWTTAGNTTPVNDAGWPTLSRSARGTKIS